MKRLLWIFVFGSVLAFLSLLAGLRSYQVFTREELVAIVEVRSPAPGSDKPFFLGLRPVAHGVSDDPQMFLMVGEQWSVGGEILKWHPWVNFLGVKNRHRLTRLSSRYLRADHEIRQPRSAYDLNGGTGPLWQFLYRAQKWIPFVEAVYGNTAHTLAQPRGRWGVYVTLSGYLIKPLHKPPAVLSAGRPIKVGLK